MPPPLLSIRDLRYRYPGSEHDTLNIPGLDISGRGLIAITGPSGAGKSTLVELLSGTLREPYEGSVKVLGREWQELHRDSERQGHLRRIGFIPQDYGLIPDRSPRQMLTQDLADAGVPAGQRSGRVEEALTTVGLGEHSERAVRELSGGQRQRVAIARMLARNVDLVIADEPTANLDPSLTAEVLALLRRLAERVPVIVVTHDPALAERCDRTVLLPAGSRGVIAVLPRRRHGLAIALGGLVVVGAVIAALVISRTGATPNRAVSLAGQHHVAVAPAAPASARTRSAAPTTTGAPVTTASPPTTPKGPAATTPPMSAAPSLSGPSPPGPSGKLYPVTQDVLLRNAPTTSGQQLATIPAATPVGVQCKQVGQSMGPYTVNGTPGLDPYWDEVVFNGLTGYVTDEWVSTHADESNNAAIPPC